MIDTNITDASDAYDAARAEDAAMTAFIAAFAAVAAAGLNSKANVNARAEDALAGRELRASTASELRDSSAAYEVARDAYRATLDARLAREQAANG